MRQLRTNLGRASLAYNLESTAYNKSDVMEIPFSASAMKKITASIILLRFDPFLTYIYM